LYFFQHISCLDWPGCCRSGLPKPNVLYGHLLLYGVLLRVLQTILVCHKLFCVYRVSPWDLLLESSEIILALFQVFFIWCMFSLLALAVCSLDLGGSFLFFSSCFSFGVAPFITIPILAFHVISHLLSLSGCFDFLRLASGPEPWPYPHLFLSSWQTYSNQISPYILINLFSSGSRTPST